MKKKQVLEVYRRYLSSLRDRNADLGANYQAMDRIINERCEDKDLMNHLNIDILFETLNAVKRRGVRLKDLSRGNWNSQAVKECYSRVKKMGEAWEEDEFERFQVMFTNFCKWLKWFEDSPCLYLYFWQVYSNTEMGYWITNREKNEDHKIVRKLLDQADSPEVEECSDANGSPTDQTDLSLPPASVA